MKYDREHGKYTLGTGREFRAKGNGVIGIGPRTSGEWLITSGYDEGMDGVVPFQGYPGEPAFTDDERREIAEEMIRRWAEWGDIGFGAGMPFGPGGASKDSPAIGPAVGGNGVIVVPAAVVESMGAGGAGGGGRVQFPATDGDAPAFQAPVPMEDIPGGSATWSAIGGNGRAEGVFDSGWGGGGDGTKR